MSSRGRSVAAKRLNIKLKSSTDSVFKIGGLPKMRANCAGKAVEPAIAPSDGCPSLIALLPSLYFHPYFTSRNRLGLEDDRLPSPRFVVMSRTLPHLGGFPLLI